MSLKMLIVSTFVLAAASPAFATVVQGVDDSSKEQCVRQVIQEELAKNKISGVEISRVASSGIPIPAGPKRYSYNAKNAQNLAFFGTILVDVESNEIKTQCHTSSGTILGVSLNMDVFTFNQQIVKY